MEWSSESGNVVMQPGGEGQQAPPLKSHDSSVLDLAFAMDCTGSMGNYIRHAQQNIRKITEEIVCSEKCDVHMALVEYRDHPPQEKTFITRVQDFTPSVGKIKNALDNSSASGGGDAPEAVADALHQVLKLNWRENSTKICVLIADAPPHGVNCSGDGFPNGCPDNLDPMQICTDMAAKGITLYVAGCEPSISPYKDVFQAFAYKTGGQYVPLKSAELLSKIIIGGAQEEISLALLMSQVQVEVDSQMKEDGAAVDEEVLTDAVFKKLSEKGAKSRALYSNVGSLEPASKEAVKLSDMKDLSELRSAYAPKDGRMSHSRVKTKKAPSFGGGRVVTDGFRGGLVTDGFGGDIVTDGFGGGLVTDGPGGGFVTDGFGGGMEEDECYDVCDGAAPAGAPPPRPSPPAKAAVTDYSVVEQNVDYEQTKRMVKKSFAMLKKKSK